MINIKAFSGTIYKVNLNKRLDKYVFKTEHDFVAKYEKNKVCMSSELLAFSILSQIESNENVLPFIDFACYRNGYVIFTELCDKTLERISIKSAKEIILGLKYLHRFLIHCDIKLDNIFIKNEVCKIADFGNAFIYGQTPNYPSNVFNSINIENGGIPNPNCDLENLVFLFIEEYCKAEINTPKKRAIKIKNYRTILPNNLLTFASEIINYKSKNHDKLHRILKF